MLNKIMCGDVVPSRHLEKQMIELLGVEPDQVKNLSARRQKRSTAAMKRESRESGLATLARYFIPMIGPVQRTWNEIHLTTEPVKLHVPTAHANFPRQRGLPCETDLAAAKLTLLLYRAPACACCWLPEPPICASKA